MIAILDYGAGNLRSVRNALDAIGAGYTLARDASSLELANKIILPGVGHFGQMMRALDELNVRAVLKQRIGAGVPFLGICLGMQALFEWSEEAPDLPGFALFPGTVKRFPAGARVPHMGWNQVTVNPSSKLLRGEARRAFFYFAHSYYAPVVGSTAATCDYLFPYTAAIEQGNVFGVQFHPEKSGLIGLQVVRNFAEP